MNTNTARVAASTALPTAMPAVAAFEKPFEVSSETAITTTSNKSSLHEDISESNQESNPRVRKALSRLDVDTFTEAEELVRADDRERPVSVSRHVPVSDILEQAFVLSGIESLIHGKQVHEHEQTRTRLPFVLAQAHLRFGEIQLLRDQPIELVLKPFEEGEAGALESNLQLNGCRTTTLPPRVHHGHGGKLAALTRQIRSTINGSISHRSISLVQAVLELQPIWYEALRADRIP